MVRITLDKKRLRREFIRHPWVYENSIASIEGKPADGDLVPAHAPDGAFVAWALLNRASRLTLRILSFNEAESDADALLQRRVREAIRLRRDILKLDARGAAWRVIHSEADGIPGLIVDRYGDYAVLSCTCLGVYQRLDGIADVLMEELSLKGLFEVGSAKGLRGKEGLPPGRGVLRGEAPPLEQVVEVDGLRRYVRVSGGQKTGLFLDQRDNARAFAALCEGERVLDACCYGGAFGLAALAAGATSVEAFDVSEKAAELCERNAELNGLSERLSISRGDLFDELRKRRDAGQRYSRVIFDPPNFAGTRRDVKAARKAYTQAHALALQVLEEEGLLATFSCSHHVTERALEETLKEAARRVGCQVQILQRWQAGADHPQDIDCPEGRYLKGLLVRRRP